MQRLDLDLKIALTYQRLREWINYYGSDGVYLSWSGGKDSTVLRHLIMQRWPEIESVFVNTGLEYPEIQQFVKAAQDRGEPVTIIRPKMRFDEVIKKYGYPVIGKTVSECARKARKNIENGKLSTQRVKNMVGGVTGKFDFSKYGPLLYVDFLVSEQCCDATKKWPAKYYEKKSGKYPIIGMLAEESIKREIGWIKTGCNAFDAKRPQSNPMAFWTEQDVLLYIKQNNVEIPSVYGAIEYVNEPEQIRWNEFDPNFNPPGDPLRCTGCQRTGCIFCAFGAHLDRPGDERFLRLKKTHPHQYAYCIGGGEYNEQGMWQPSKEGLGMGHVFDVLNGIYGDDFIRYK